MGCWACIGPAAAHEVKPLRGGMLIMGTAGGGGCALLEASVCSELREMAAVGGPLLMIHSS